MRKYLFNAIQMLTSGWAVSWICKHLEQALKMKNAIIPMNSDVLRWMELLELLNLRIEEYLYEFREDNIEGLQVWPLAWHGV